MTLADQIASHRGTTTEFFLGDWLVQPRMGLATRGGRPIHLEPKAMQVLACLASQAGSVVSKDELLQSVWPHTFVSEHVLTHAIWQLREIFGDSDFIQTIPRIGYRLTMPVRYTAPRIRSIAVLPLANLSGDPGQEFFADGMTEALITALAQIQSLRVISRTSAMRYKETRKSLPEIAGELNVDGVLEGSVIRSGGRVRVTVQLIRAAADEHLWANTYERDLCDILELQDEVARTIAHNVQITLSADEDRRLGRSRPINPEAHDAYLKGRYCYFRMSEAGLRMSIEYMQRAISADPDYAPAYAGLANSAAVLSRLALMPPQEAHAIIWPAVARALELDPALSDAYCMLGSFRLYHDWDWGQAEEALQHAIELNPSSSMAYGSLGELYEALNRPDDAIRAWTQACKLDPLSVFFPALLGGTLVLAGRPGQAAEQLQNTIRQEPNYWLGYEILSFAFADLRRREEAMEAAETAVRLAPDAVPRTALGYIYGRFGRRDDTRRILNDLQRLYDGHCPSPLLPAALHTALGDFDPALDLIEEGCRVRDPVVVLLRSFPFWRPLHRLERFRRIIRQMNFPE